MLTLLILSAAATIGLLAYSIWEAGHRPATECQHGAPVGRCWYCRVTFKAW